MNSPFTELNAATIRRERVEAAERAMHRACTVLLCLIAAGGAVLVAHHFWALQFPVMP